MFRDLDMGLLVSIKHHLVFMLCESKEFFSVSAEAGVDVIAPITQGGKRGEADIDTHLLMHLGQGSWLPYIDNRHEPLTRGCPTKGTVLGVPSRGQ